MTDVLPVLVLGCGLSAFASPCRAEAEISDRKEVVEAQTSTYLPSCEEGLVREQAVGIGERAKRINNGQKGEPRCALGKHCQL